MKNKFRTLIPFMIFSLLFIPLTGCDGDNRPLSEAEKAMAISKNENWYENNVIGVDLYSYQLTIRDHDFKVTVSNDDLMIKAENSNNSGDEFYIKIVDDTAQFISFSNSEYHSTLIEDPLFTKAIMPVLFPDSLNFVWENVPTYVGIGQIVGPYRKDITTYYLTEYHLDSSLIYAPFTIYDDDFYSNNHPIVLNFTLYEDENNLTEEPFTDSVYQILATNLSPDILRVLSEIFAVDDYPFIPAPPLEDEPDLMILFNQNYNETETFSLPVID